MSFMRCIEFILVLCSCEILEPFAFHYTTYNLYNYYCSQRSSVVLSLEVGSIDPLVTYPDLNRIESFRAPLSEIDRRRNFAIISHPDAGW